MKSRQKKIPRPLLRTEKIKASLFSFMDGWLNKKSSVILIFILFLSALFALLLFNIRISEGGDDSVYIEWGYKYSQNFFGEYYTFNAPLFPILLSLPILLFGLKLSLLKFVSFIFLLLHLFCFFITFRKRVPGMVLFPTLFIIGLNSYFLYYASQTYNEAFVLFVQAIFFYSFFLLIDKLKTAENSFLYPEKYWLFFGFMAFVLTMSKNITVLALPSFVFFFLINGQYKNAVYSVLSLAIFKKSFEVFKENAWDSVSVQHQGQLAVLLQKDPYHPEKGMEDLAGFLGRLWDNSNIYLSKRFLQILHLKSDLNNNTHVYITIFVILLFGWSLFRIFRNKDKYMLFIAIYTAFILGATFLMLQTAWDQPRLILIYMPMMLLIIFYGIYDLLRKRSVILQAAYLCLVVSLIVLSFSATLKKTRENLPILQRNLKGDLYYGYTEDLKNYLLMSEWCGKNLPDTALVACRKASMSFIYSGGKRFFPVYTASNQDADSILSDLKANKVTHILVASLRKNSKKADPNGIINTMQRLLKPINDKYPQKLKIVHQFGTAKSKETLVQSVPEPAYLVQINY